ncbi:hypothetical protein KI688_009241 [Linnemannia hyalina]|uniref:Mid2 domain-containing protein n=1 Tax=Linnemannia hyalina TaxID=64524 RepID=A0A9P7Y261_9FUNG|nr:hypothetical protein KI688_009241 [Linnemannia hyalina]
MRLSRFSSSPTPLLITLLLFIITLSTSLHTITASTVNSRNNKRDLLGNIFPHGSSSAPPAATPAGSPSPTVPTAPGTGGTGGTQSNSTATGPLPGLISQVLDPPVLGNIGGVPSSTTPTKKLPSGGSGANDDSTPDDDGNPATPNQSSNAKSGKGNNPNSNGGPLSPGLIVLLVVILLAILAGVLFSCYRIRQSRRRRHQSWDEDILKNHAGSVGYSESGGGYGMYVGNGGKERPDLWRKNLDLFHRE